MSGRRREEGARRARDGAGRAREGARWSSPTARDVALDVLVRADAGGAYADLALRQALRRWTLPPREAAFAAELALGAVRRLNTLDWHLERAGRPAAALEPVVRGILRLATYQIFYTRVPAYAAVSEAVAQARRAAPRAAGLVNAVLRRLAGEAAEPPFPPLEEDPVRHLALVHSHPEWLVRRWLARYGLAATEAMLRHDNEAPPLTVRVNRLRASPEEAVRRLATEGVTARPGRYLPGALTLEGAGDVERLAAFREGLIQVQDEAAQLAGLAVAPEPGMLVLDAAAAPGGKATHLAELMEDRGTVVANDVHPSRLRLVEANARRLGLSSVRTRLGDAAGLAGEYRGRADRVLLDAPCSGLGVLRRRADARWRKGEDAVARMAEVQRRLLAAVAPCVAPGGILVYCTCTTEPEENDRVADWFLAVHPGFAPAGLAGVLPEALLQGEEAGAGRLQLLPFRHGLDGFFIARFQRLR